MSAEKSSKVEKVGQKILFGKALKFGLLSTFTIGLVIGAVFIGAAFIDDKSSSSKKHECDRICQVGETPKTCRYSFNVELYNSLNKACYNCPLNITDCDREHCIPGDGFEKGLIVVNRQMPGPSVVVCQGDRIIVDVTNHLTTETTSIHFHGEHFRDHQYMDGTPHVTQCPILPSAKFRYDFNADVPGTHFWHSHNSFQRGDGMFGPFVVREPQILDPNGHLYDADLTEHILFAQEWFHESTREAFVKHHWDTGKNKADNILINGRGKYVAFTDEQSQNVTTPSASFSVKSGQRYRFRVVSPGFTLCPILVSVENHTDLTVISSDGKAFEPFNVSSFVIHPAERYDFVLNANQEPGIYQMRFGGLFDCSNLKAHTVALLNYEEVEPPTQEEEELITSTYEETTEVTGIQLNPLNYAPPPGTPDFWPEKIPFSKMSRPNRNCTNEIMNEPHHKSPLKALEKDLKADPGCELPHALQKETPDKIFYMAYDLYARENPHFHHEDLYGFDDVLPGNELRTPQMNNITLAAHVSPLLSQEADIDPKNFCDANSTADKDCGGEDWCECLHVIRIDLGDVVEIVLIDEGVPYDVSHPFHMHGHSFYVVSMERHAPNATHTGPSAGGGNFIRRDQVIDMDLKGEIRRNLVDPPMKDSVPVPDSGFTIVRFHADNPGYWIVHCHMSWHNHLGMGFVMKVGDIEKDVGPPPEGFPTCNNFPIDGW